MKQALIDRLQDVLDPETGASVLSLGVVRRVEVRDRTVEVELDGRHPLVQHFRDEVEAVVRDTMADAALEVRLVA